MVRSSKSSKKSGNTKQISAARYWCFTLNNYNKNDISNILRIPKEKVPGFVFQEERGEEGEENEGTIHLQGVIDFGKGKKERPKRYFEQILRHNKTHWEKTKNIKASVQYCQKLRTRIGKTFFRGWEKPWICPKPRWSWWMEKILIQIGKPVRRKIDWYYSIHGDMNKTLFCKWIEQNYEGVCILGGKAGDMKYRVAKYFEQKGYTPKICLFNLAKGEDLDYIGLENIQDMLFFSGKYDSVSINGPWPHIIVLANYEPYYERMSQDRWNVTNITEEKFWTVELINGEKEVCFQNQNKFI